MFVVNSEDNSIYVTRGDAGTISVSAKVDGENNYVFRAGDVVRFKVTQKKACENVVLQKDFPITVDTEIVDIYLSEKDTKIGDVISKPVDYWYEVELNPFTNPQTIIGYDDDGAKIFKLHPEGRDLVDDITEEDIPVVDTELSLTSEKPVQNQVIARAVVRLIDEIATERGRISKLANGEEVTDTYASELVNVRVGANGQVYPSAGESVRGQFKILEKLFTMPTQEAVNKWLDEHPEATTTVQDKSLTIDKMVLGTLGYVTPQMFGAVGDGVADDTNAFELALKENKPIYVPSGTYLVNGLNFHYFKNRIFGDGDATTIITMQPINFIGCHNVVVENITFTTNTNLDYIIRITKTYHAIFEKIKLSAGENLLAKIGILCDASEPSYFHSFSNCRFVYFPTAIKFTHNSNRCTVTDCEFYLCGTCVLIDSCNGICISNSAFQSYTVCGVKFEYNNYGSPTKGNIITGNYFEFGEINENSVGHADFTNNIMCSYNTFIGNNYSYTTNVPKYANTENVHSIILDTDGTTFNQNIELPGYTKQQVLPHTYRSAYQENKLGCITPFEEEDGSVSFYANVKKSDGTTYWGKIPIVASNGALVHPRIESNSIEQYWGGRIILGSNGEAMKQCLTFDNSYGLPKIYIGSNWKYFQVNQYGGSDSRPVGILGHQYFDTTLGKPIWFNGTNWVDSTGSVV